MFCAMTRRAAKTAAAAILAVVTVAVSLTAGPAAAGPEEAAALCSAARHQPVTGRITDRRVREASGLVRLGESLWVHNDSGDRARLFRLSSSGSGAVRAELRLPVSAADWEDASGSGRAGEVFVGDIGDNAGRRGSVTVHRFRVPDLWAYGVDYLPSSAVQRITLRYPDGPRDAEALIVDPRTRDLVIIQKRYGGPSGVYWAPESDWRDGSATLRRAGTVYTGSGDRAVPTAADIRADGSVIAIRTYSSVLMIPRWSSQSVASALVSNRACWARAVYEPQGETIAFSGGGYVTVSEGGWAPINRFRP